MPLIPVMNACPQTLSVSKACLLAKGKILIEKDAGSSCVSEAMLKLSQICSRQPISTTME